MCSYLKKNLILGILILGTSLLFAQRPVNYDSPEYEYNLAVELLQKEKYGSAQQYFKYVYEHTHDKQQDIKSNSYFYMGICAAQLYNEDAIFLLKDFIRHYPVHSYVPEAYYHLGKFYFYKRQYKKVLDSFSQIDERNVRPTEMAEYRFKLGYSYFATGDSYEAKYHLNQARLEEGEYQLRAIYYLAHIAYEEQNYEPALQDFLLLKDEPEYQNVVPYYIVQIYFLQKRYEELIAVAPPLFEKTTDKNKSDIARSLALAYYNLGMYKNAEEYFDFYLNDKNAQPDRKDNFAAGYTYYNTENFSKSIKYLSESAKDSVDIITQTALYVIGDCYLKSQQLDLAKQSFYEASKLDFSSDIKEDALYNYAKLQYATSSQPFNNAIKALEEYINKYPYSTRSEEAQEYLSNIYMSTKNYQGAIKSLEKISSKNNALMRAYQRCTYFRAMELVDNKDYRQALTLIEKSLIYPMDAQINLSALFWKGEILYRNNQFSESVQAMKLYQRQDDAKNDDNYLLSYYTVGYDYMKLKKYKEAETAFNTVLKSSKLNDRAIESDAKLRLADAYYMQKRLKQAAKLYAECAEMGVANVDYALFQQAKCAGYDNDNNQKVQILQSFQNQYQKSAYVDDVDFELAATLHAENRYDEAIEAYKKFIKEHPKSKYIREVHNKLAQAYQNTQNSELAISTFQYVFETYPGSQEAKDAITNLENIYTEQGNTSEFFEYIRNKNLDYSVTKQDSVIYKSARSKYDRGECEAAIKGFDDYLSQFPQGLFAADAYFYKGECEYGNRYYDKALNSYKSLIDNYNTSHNETAIRKISYILYSNKEYSQALYYFNKLVEVATSQDNTIYGNNGVMRCSFETEQYRKSLIAAENLLNYSQIEADLKEDAYLYAGKSSIYLGELDNAKKYLTKLAKSGNNAYCSEAAYYLAEIEFNSGNLSACESRIRDIISGDYRSDYWLAKTFILYGDYYKAIGNSFQARYTYQSIVDNFQGEELRQIAIQKIAELDSQQSDSENNPQSETPDSND